MEMKRGLTLFFIGALACAALAQPAGVVPPGGQVSGTVPKSGGQPVGVVPPMNPYTGRPYPTPYGPFEQPWWRPVSSVPVLMAGLGAPTSRTMTYVVGTQNEWEWLYREIFPPAPFEDVYPPALASFSNDVLIVLRLPATTDTDVVPTLDAIEPVDAVTTVVRYSIWTPTRRAPDRQDGDRRATASTAKKEPRPTKEPEIRTTYRRLASPYVVARVSRVNGQYRFSGQTQYYRPSTWGHRDRG